MGSTHVTVPITFTRLYSEDLILRELAPLGVNRKMLRNLFRALGVPVMYLGDGVLVDPVTLSIALKAVLSLGKPDFVAPGTKGKQPSSFDPDSLPDGELESFMGQLLVSVKLTETTLDSEVKVAARDAVARMREMGLRALIDLRKKNMEARARVQTKEVTRLE